LELGLGEACRTARRVKRCAVGALAALVAFSSIITGAALADPAQDALAKFKELARESEQTTEAMHSAQIDLDEKLSEQRTADTNRADAQAAADAAKSQLATFQSAVNQFAAAMYMGGRTDDMGAILTADSPQQLIGTLATQRVIATQMSAQMASYRGASARAVQAERASAKSAIEARTTAEQAAAVRANLQSKQSQLQSQMAVVKSKYVALTQQQRAALAKPGPPPPPRAAAPPPPPPGEEDPEASEPPEAPDPESDGDQRAAAVEAALTQLGSSYVWGGETPGAFDCSGLVMWAFRQAGVALPRSSQAMDHGGQAVALDDLQPGDVLTFHRDASHVGLYLGDGLMVHSPNFGETVRVAPMTESGPIHNARRF
jgi:cell wall-associated NlpC family hydrolase